MLFRSRADFTPTLWQEPADNVTQVWFAGAHADVGGGYEQAGLSDIALEWMAGKLADAQLLFSDPRPYTPKCDAALACHEPWSEAPWDALLKAGRSVPKGACVHGSLLKRGKLNAAALASVMSNGALDPALCTIVQWSETA